MRNENKVPSQDEIESILSWRPQDGLDSSDEAERAVPAAPVLSDETQKILSRMSERLETLGPAMERIAQLERGLTETNSAVRLIHQDMQTMAGQVQLVSSRVKGILSNLKSTLGYRARNTYVCASCNSKGKVAARMKCTHCRRENWWGWWTSKSHDDSNDDEDSVH